MKRLIPLIITIACALSAPAHEVPFGTGTLSVTAPTAASFRIQYKEKEMPALPEWVYVDSADSPLKKSGKGHTVTFTTTSGYTLTADTRRLELRVNDPKGKEVFRSYGHRLRPATVAGTPTFEAQVRIQSAPDEHLYGLGQFQDGYTDIRGLSRRLTQVNTQISIPMFLSSKGYGVLWNNYGMTEFNPSDQSVTLAPAGGEGVAETVNVTSTTGGQQERRVRNLFRASLTVPADGLYSLLLDVGQTMARRHHLAVDGLSLLRRDNLWLPPTASLICRLKAGTHTVEAELERADKPVLHYQPLPEHTLLRSPVARAVDYTILLGSPDEMVATYRNLTGNAPMMPKWALGYIHCRERFHSSREIIETAQKFRDQRIPLDLIVQDWQWWGNYGWNAMRFDETHYPDPRRLVDSLHHIGVRLMLSVWSKIDRNSEVGRAMARQGHYIPGTDWIDFFNPDAAAHYWDNFSARLLRPYGIDAWWQDATEPENDDLTGRTVGAGKYPGETFRNVYPLLVSKTVYEGSRRDAPAHRTMILTRCAAPGIQRYGAAMWSGDVGNDFPTLRAQIAAGLGMQAAGMPWWTFDAGGFFRPPNQHTDSLYIERMLRWIQVAAYLPLMRVHGYMSDTEPWRYGREAQAIITECINERYRLLPYIYSAAAEVTFGGSAIMRPLFFDFPDDERALRQDVEYMFGRALLVSPVTEASPAHTETYLPAHPAGWYDFRTGRHYPGGQTARQKATLDAIPVFAKGGSIVPMGHSRQSTAAPTDGSISLRVFPGADASFKLYDDEGTNYNYERGAYTVIPLSWDDARRTLTIGRREGAFEGMRHKWTFTISLPDGQAKNVEYQGKKTVVNFGE